MSEVQVGSAELAVPASWVRGGTSKCWIFRASEVDGLPITRDEFCCGRSGARICGRSTGSGAPRRPPARRSSSRTWSPPSRRRRSSTRSPRSASTTRGSSGQQLRQLRHRAGVVRGPARAGGDRRGRHRAHDAEPADRLVLRATVPTPGATAPSHGGQLVRGVPFPGVPVDLGFTEATWSTHGALLPTGRPVDRLTIDGSEYAVTMIDAGAPVAVVRADQVGSRAPTTPPRWPPGCRSSPTCAGSPPGRWACPTTISRSPRSASSDPAIRTPTSTPG